MELMATKWNNALLLQEICAETSWGHKINSSSVPISVKKNAATQCPIRTDKRLINRNIWIQLSYGLVWQYTNCSSVLTFVCALVKIYSVCNKIISLFMLSFLMFGKNGKRKDSYFWAIDVILIIVSRWCPLKALIHLWTGLAVLNTFFNADSVPWWVLPVF